MTQMMHITKNVDFGAVEFHCPHCGSDDYQTLDSGIEDDYYFYSNECQNCQTMYTEWYRLEFREIVYDIEEEKVTDEERTWITDSYERESYTGPVITIPDIKRNGAR